MSQDYPTEQVSCSERLFQQVAWQEQQFGGGISYLESLRLLPAFPPGAWETAPQFLEAVWALPLGTAPPVGSLDARVHSLDTPC